MNLENINYISSGFFTTFDKWRHSERTIDSHEIILVTEGTLYIQEEEMKFRVKPGEIIYLEPGKRHKGYNYNRIGKTISFYWMHFESPVSIKNIKTFPLKNYKTIKSYLKQLLDLTNTPGVSKNSYDYMTRIFLEAVILDNEMENCRNISLVSDISAYIKSKIRTKLKVKDIADHFSYNESYITRIFKETYKIGIKEYIHNEKMKIAKNLLGTTEYSIEKISRSCGFDDGKEFLKFFKYHEGISPTKFRERYTNPQK